MGISLDGLASGLDTTTLISSLMQVESVPQNLLKAKVTQTQSTVSALQSLNTQIADLAASTKKTAAPAALDLYTASSSAGNVKATVGTGATAGSLDIVVSKLAASQISVSAPLTSWPDSGPLTLVVGGVAKEITLKSSSLDDVATAINSAGTGVTATKVAVGDGTYRMQFSSTATGSAAAFTVQQGTAAAVAAGTATQLPTTTTRTAQNAEVTLWANSAAKQVVTSSSNTFADLLPGVAVTVNAVSADAAVPTTLTISRDDNAISSSASGMVSTLNNIFAVITNRSTVTTGTSSTGATTVTAGAFTGDSTIRDVSQKLLSAASQPIDGHSPSEFGISITKSGTLTFDQAKFTTALGKDPEATKAAVATIAARVSAAATQASDPYTGLITTKITGQQADLKDFNNSIADWDDRLATREASLKKTYAAMEVALSSIKSQGDWLSSQLAGLPTSSDS
jgi:flagellar hook-associated protein 2